MLAEHYPLRFSTVWALECLFCMAFSESYRFLGNVINRITVITSPYVANNLSFCCYVLSDLFMILLLS